MNELIGVFVTGCGYIGVLVKEEHEFVHIYNPLASPKHDAYLIDDCYYEELKPNHKEDNRPQPHNSKY